MDLICFASDLDNFLRCIVNVISHRNGKACRGPQLDLECRSLLQLESCLGLEPLSGSVSSLNLVDNIDNMQV